MDEQAVERALELDAELARAARAAWLDLVDLAVWGDLKSPAPGVLPRIRKRALDAGERLKSMFARRHWIPHPRERLKNALASLLNLQRSLEELERALAQLDGGGDLERLRRRCVELGEVAKRLAPAAARWAALLDTQYDDGNR